MIFIILIFIFSLISTNAIFCTSHVDPQAPVPSPIKSHQVRPVTVLPQTQQEPHSMVSLIPINSPTPLIRSRKPTPLPSAPSPLKDRSAIERTEKEINFTTETLRKLDTLCNARSLGTHLITFCGCRLARFIVSCCHQSGSEKDILLKSDTYDYEQVCIVLVTFGLAKKLIEIESNYRNISYFIPKDIAFVIHLYTRMYECGGWQFLGIKIPPQTNPLLKQPHTTPPLPITAIQNQSLSAEDLTSTDHPQKEPLPKRN